MSVASAIAYKTARDCANAWRIVRGQSRFKAVFILCFATVCEAGLWLLFLHGFRFLDSFAGFGGVILGRLFSLFFFGVGAMLVMSSIVTAYSTFFRSEEIGFLMAQPLTVSQIVVYKFMEATGFASWAFFFVVVPFIGAYAWEQHLTWMLAVWTLLYAIPFLLLCAGLGALILMTFVRWFPTGRIGRDCGFALAATAVTALWLSSRHAYDATANIQFTIARLVPGLVLAGHPLMPSAWMADGIMALANGQWQRGILLWGMLVSSALVVGMSVEWLGSRIFFDCWQRVLAGGSNRRRTPVMLVGLERALRFADKDVRAIAMKDIRTFLRDPAQWSQALIFFGLLGMYFANLRSFNTRLLGENWRSIMVFLNVFSVSAVVCSLGSRFVYPQLSLEGQEKWILGLSPTTMRRVLMTKFVMAFVGMVTVSIVLVLLSTIKLEAGGIERGACVAVAGAVALAVCGLSCGLGAVFLDLRQRNPSAIVSGFGGTLNLVLSLLFMLMAILPFAGIFHLEATVTLTPAQFHYGLLAAGVWLTALTAAATLIPLKLGIRSLKQRDF